MSELPKDLILDLVFFFKSKAFFPSTVTIRGPKITNFQECCRFWAQKKSTSLYLWVRFGSPLPSHNWGGDWARWTFSQWAAATAAKIGLSLGLLFCNIIILHFLAPLEGADCCWETEVCLGQGGISRSLQDLDMASSLTVTSKSTSNAKSCCADDDDTGYPSAEPSMSLQDS